MFGSIGSRPCPPCAAATVARPSECPQVPATVLLRAWPSVLQLNRDHRNDLDVTKVVSSGDSPEEVSRLVRGREPSEDDTATGDTRGGG